MRRLAKEGLLGRGGSPGLEPRGLGSSNQRGRRKDHHRVRSEVHGQAGCPPYWHEVNGARLSAHAPAASGCQGSERSIGEEDGRGDAWLVLAFRNAPASAMACISEIHSEHSKFYLYMAVAVPDPDQRGQKIWRLSPAWVVAKPCLRFPPLQ